VQRRDDDVGRLRISSVRAQNSKDFHAFASPSGVRMAMA
jgi:hypothetical protein